MQDISPDTSRKFANLGFFCAILVVIIHVRLPEPAGSPAWWVYTLTSYRAIAVPFFFLMSGYFLAGHIGESGWWKNENLKRIRTLLIPYVAWSVFWTLLRAFQKIVGNVHHGEWWLHGCRGLLLDPTFLGLDPFSAPQLAILWYVRSLLIFMLASPLLFWILKKAPRLVLGIALLKFLLYTEAAQGSLHYFVNRVLTLDMVVFFLLGIALRKDLIPTPRRKYVGRVLIAVISLWAVICYAKAFGGLADWSPIPRYVFGRLGRVYTLLWMYFIWMVMPAKPLPRMLQNTSFAIYLVHWFVLCGFWHRYAYKTPGGALDLVIDIFVGIFGTLAVVLCMKWFFPKISAVLFGGRG